jgi:MFS family permease
MRTDTRMTARHKVVLALLLGTQFMLTVDFSIFNVALPAIGDGVGLTALQWVITAYALPAAGFTLLSGRIADLAGRRRMFLIGLVLLAAASLGGGLATEPAALLAARAAQGLATAISMPAALALITTTFAEGPLRERALGLNGSITATGFTTGALLGGVLTELLGWRWAFLVNVPVAVIILVLVPILIPADAGDRRTRLDLPGALTVTLGLLALVWGITTPGAARWALLPAALLLVAFWYVELRSPHPLAPLHVLRRPTVGLGNLGGLTTAAMATGVTFLMTVHLQETLNLSPMLTGLAFGVPGVLAIAGGVVAPLLIAPLGAPGVLALGLAAQGLSTAALLLLDGDAWFVTAALAVCYVGNMIALVAAAVTATSGLPNHEQGLATGLNAMAQQVGITVGIPVLSALGDLHLGVGVAAAATLAVALAVRVRG